MDEEILDLDEIYSCNICDNTVFAITTERFRCVRCEKVIIYPKGLRELAESIPVDAIIANTLKRSYEQKAIDDMITNGPSNN